MSEFNNNIHALVHDEHIMQYECWPSFDVIPTELQNYYKENVYELLIFGYAAKIENKYRLSRHIHFYIKKMIMTYYTHFMTQ